MPRLHQIERQLIDAIAIACPNVYRRWFVPWINCDSERRDNPRSRNCVGAYRERCHSWYIMSDLVDEAGRLQLAALMRTMPAVMPMLMRWTMHERNVNRQERMVPRTPRGRRTVRDGTRSYRQTRAIAAFTNHDRACLEMFDVLLSRPHRLMAYARMDMEVNGELADAGHRGRRVDRLSYKRGNIGTWTSLPLGRLRSGRGYINNFGDGRLPVTVQCINGCEYTGTYYFTAGDCCRLTMVKRDEAKVDAGRWDFDCPMLKDGNPIKFPDSIRGPVSDDAIAVLQ